MTSHAFAPPKSGKTVRGPRLHLEFLDGIRACAAVFVVVHHMSAPYLGFRTRPGLLGVLTNWLSYGHLAVDVFIVLSGFSLMLPVAQRGILVGGSTSFYARRARRILPPFYAALVFATLWPNVIELFGHHHYHAISLKAFLVNALLLQDLFPAWNTIDPVFWSVAVECKIYLLFPLVVWLWRRRGPAAVLLCGAILGYGLSGLLPLLIPGLTIIRQGLICPWYVWLFTMGACAATIAFPQIDAAKRAWDWRIVCGGLSLALAVLLALFPWGTEGPDSAFVTHLFLIDPVVGALTACGLIAMAQAQGVGRPNIALAWFAWKPLVRIGTFAYSIYLLHQPLLYAIRILLDRFASHRISSIEQFGLTVLLGLPAVIGLSYLFFIFFERPFLNTRPYATRDEDALAAAISPAP